MKTTKEIIKILEKHCEPGSDLLEEYKEHVEMYGDSYQEPICVDCDEACYGDCDS